MSYDPKACGAQCDKCPLFGSVPVPPDVGHSAKICVVGEAPGVDEIREGRPFVGASGLELHRGLTAARILKRDVHLTNVLLCQPPKNELSNLLARISAENREKDKRNKAKKKAYEIAVKRDPTVPVPLYEEAVMSPIDCCAPRLQAEVNQYTDFITLGGVATRSITGSTQSILSLRGGTIDLVAGRGLPARRVMPTVHPSFVLRAQRWTSVFRGDLFRANKWFTGTMTWTPPTVVYNPSPAWLDAFLNQPGIPYWTYDLETDGIEPLTANLRCVGIGTPDGRVTIVGLLSRDGISKFYTEQDELRVIEIMKAFFTNPKIVKAGHNCLYTGTPVILGDDTSEPIEALVRRKYDGTVKALDKEGRITEARVTGWFREKVPNQAWLVVRRKGEKKHARGLTLTPDHEVYTTRGRVRAECLAPGDEILTGERALEEDERQALLGTLLGDSSAFSSSSRKEDGLLINVRVAVVDAPAVVLRGGHSVKELVEQKNRWLGGFLSTSVDGGRKGGYRTGADFHTYRTPQSRQIAEIARPVYAADGERHINTALLDQLGPVGLAWLYADDGFKHTRPDRSREAMLIATCGFSDEEIEETCTWFCTNFGPTTRTAEGSVRIGVEASQQFAQHIAPYLLPAARYKLPKGDWPAFVGFPERSARPYAVEVESVEPFVPPTDTSTQRAFAQTRWCLQTTEGNFLTGFGFVKNCGSYDTSCLNAQWGIDVAPQIDTILLHRLTASELPHSLGFVGSIYTDAPSWKTDREGNKIAFSAESDEQLHEYCIFEGTRVVTEDGTKKIEDIVRSRWGGRVLSKNASGALEFRSVTGWHYSVDEAVKWVRVRFEGEKERDVGLICTPDHRLIGPSGEVEAQNLEAGDEIYHAEDGTRRVVSVEPYVHPHTTDTRRHRAFRRYCIDVEQNHNFFTTAGLVHNCAMDVRVTSMLLPPLFDAVKTRGQSGLIAADHRVQKICAEMHRVGMWVDQAKRLEYEKKYVKEAAFRLEELRRSSPIADFNPGSPHQIRRLLFDDWNLVAPLDEKERYTASGDPATSDDVLRSLLTLSHLTPQQREFIYGLRKYRKAQKLLGTYIVKLRPSTQSADLGWDEEAEPEDYDVADEEALNLRRRAERETREKYGLERTGIVNPRTGRMYPGYNSHVAVTGRLSSSKPINAQNFPKNLRAMVRAAPGHVLIGADADQLELRIAAAIWGAKRYLAAFAASADPHSSTALACFGETFRNAAGFPGGKWVGDLFVPNGEGKWTGEGKTFRDLAKRVQYACCGKGTKVVTAAAEGSIEIENIKDGMPLWAWSRTRGRYESTKAVGDAKFMGRKRTIRIHLAWGQGNTYRSEMVLTPDHLCMLRDGTWRAAGNLQPGDRLMPFWRFVSGAAGGLSYRHLRPYNDGRRVAEHRIMQGFYEPGEGDTHVHHKDEDTFNNDPENLEPLNHRVHYELHKESMDEGRRTSLVWRASVADSETRRAATQKSWDGGERKEPVYASKLDAFVEHIGIKTDREVAEMAGCTPENVGHYRKTRGIGKPAGQRGGIREQILVLREKLGVLSDTEIAEMVGCDRANVSRLRESLNIPSAPRKKHRSSSLLDAYAERIGHETDIAIAAAAGCTPENVMHYRKVRGIPAYWRECPEGSNHVVLGVSDVGEEDVWDIEVDHEDHNFALEAGVFVHNSQYMATVETVHRVICQTETEGKGGKTELPYLSLALAEVRKMHQAWLDGCPEFPMGWDREIDEWRRQGYLMEPIDFRRRDFLDGENPNELVNFKIQSSAAALMNRAIIALADEVPCEKWGRGTGIINQCHDALVLEVPADGAELITYKDETTGEEKQKWVIPEGSIPWRTMHVLNEAMNQEHPALPGVKITAAADIGLTWKEVG